MNNTTNNVNTNNNNNTNNNTIVINNNVQPVAVVSPTVPTVKGGSGNWKYELCGCLGNPLACLYVCFCPPCAAGEIFSGDCFGCSCIMGCCLFQMCSVCYPCLFTGPVRRRYGINGNCCCDLLLCMFCLIPCQMTRELREVRGQ